MKQRIRDAWSVLRWGKPGWTYCEGSLTSREASWRDLFPKEPLAFTDGTPLTGGEWQDVNRYFLQRVLDCPICQVRTKPAWDGQRIITFPKHGRPRNLEPRRNVRLRQFSSVDEAMRAARRTRLLMRRQLDQGDLTAWEVCMVEDDMAGLSPGYGNILRARFGWPAVEA